MLWLKRIAIVVPLTIGGLACFEHMRHIYYAKHRKDKVKSHWEQIDTVEPTRYITTFADYLLLPLTYTLGWFEPITIWKQKFYHSLSVAGRYVNPFIEWQDRNATDLFAYVKWQLTRNNRNGIPKNTEELDRNLPLMEPNFNLLFKKAEPKDLSASWVVEQEKDMTVTWIGQSTCFVQMDGYNILTDPIFSTRTMGEWFGPKRLRQAPCSLKDLPQPDIVLISHNHYDHLGIFN